MKGKKEEPELGLSDQREREREMETMERKK